MKSSKLWLCRNQSIWTQQFPMLPVLSSGKTSLGFQQQDPHPVPCGMEGKREGNFSPSLGDGGKTASTSRAPAEPQLYLSLLVTGSALALLEWCPSIDPVLPQSASTKTAGMKQDRCMYLHLSQKKGNLRTLRRNSEHPDTTAASRCWSWNNLFG